MSDSDILSIQLWFGAAALTFLAIAMTAAGWNHKYFIRSMFGVAALMALLAIFWPQIHVAIPDQIQKWIATESDNHFVWLGMFVVGMSTVLGVARLRGLGSPVPKAIQTSLRLQFYPNSINPICLELHNISNWYALRQSFLINEAPSPQFPQGRQIEARTWTIYIVFDRPVAMRQVVFDAHGAQVPTIEAKDRSARHVVIYISSDMPGALLDINVVV
ncbi:MAG: hypothetical protein ABSA68_03145 [Xanthobacteraceae bacterium]|jgi:hypothetical protein